MSANKLIRVVFGLFALLADLHTNQMHEMIIIADKSVRGCIMQSILLIPDTM